VASKGRLITKQQAIRDRTHVFCFSRFRVFPGETRQIHAREPTKTGKNLSGRPAWAIDQACTAGWAGNVVSPKRRKNRCDRCWAYHVRRAKSGLQRRLRRPSGMANSFAVKWVGSVSRVLSTVGNKIPGTNEHGAADFPARRPGQPGNRLAPARPAFFDRRVELASLGRPGPRSAAPSGIEPLTQG
jgi:hypothetical protein